MTNPLRKLFGLVNAEHATPAPIERPEPTAPRMIVGGRSAPELCCLPVDLIQHGDGTTLNAGLHVAQFKADGIRALYIDGRIVTREGLPLDCAAHCQPGLRALEEAFGHPMMFDCEYVAEGGFNATLAEHKAGVGNGCVWVFDAVPMGAWVTGSWDVGTFQRLTDLRAAFYSLPVDRSAFVGMIDFRMLDRAGVMAWANAIWAEGGEGVVVKRADAGYDRRRSDAWQRIKERFTHDGAIVDVGLKAGKLDRVVVKGPDGVGPITLRRGWKEAEAATIINALNRTHSTAQLVAEVAFQLTTGGVRRSVRGATWVRLRSDKGQSA